MKCPNCKHSTNVVEHLSDEQLNFVKENAKSGMILRCSECNTNLNVTGVELVNLLN
ncbi:MAG: hypothetical protein JRE23_12205 [Deltaproteobacteria bacterium]|nr:hypothetical protein [Deltaproteobacteria bacterium]